jgi:hypothetical protein
MRMRPADLLRVGQIVLAGGVCARLAIPRHRDVGRPQAQRIEQDLPRIVMQLLPVPRAIRWPSSAVAPPQ